MPTDPGKERRAASGPAPGREGIFTVSCALLHPVAYHSFTGTGPWRSALQTMLIGSLAAAAAFGIARAISP